MPNFLWRVISRTESKFGVVLFLIAGIGVFTPLRATVDFFKVEAIIVFLVLALSSYGVYRKERIMRSERESQIRLIARPSSLFVDNRFHAPDEIHVHALINIEIYAEIDVDTDGIALNFIETGPRMKLFWKWNIGHEMIRLKGLPPKGQDTKVYRKSIRLADKQPFKDSIEFDWQWKADSQQHETYLLELVLITGRPDGTWRAIVDPRLYERGSKEPV